MSVEGKQKIKGNRSGTSWEIEAKGITRGGEGFFIVECKRYPKRGVEQEKVGGLAYRILDAGADGAIIVSPVGLQEGAEKIADAEKIISVLLPETCTARDFAIQFLDKLFLGVSATVTSSAFVKMRLVRACATCSKLFPIEEHESLCGYCR